MARDYILHREASSFTAKPHPSHLPIEGDPIPMYRRTGEVVEVVSPHTAIIKAEDEYFLEANNSIKQTNRHKMKTIPLKKLTAYKDGDVIEAIEGVLITLNEPTDQAPNGTQLKEMRQTGVIDDGTMEHRIMFIGDAVLAPVKDFAGKNVRLDSTMGKNEELNGIEMDERNPAKRVIRVYEDAEVTLLTAGGEPRGIVSRNKKTKHMSKGPTIAETFEERADLYLMGLDYILPLAEARGLDLKEAKDIATTIFLTFKGQYGVYNDPVISGEQPEPPTRPKQESKPEPSKAPEVEPHKRKAPPPIESWRDTPHKNGKTLGELPDESLMNLIEWALVISPDSLKKQENRVKHGKLLLAAGELAVTPRKLADRRLLMGGHGEKFEDEAVVLYLEKEFGKDLGEMDANDWVEFLKGHEIAIEKIIKIHNSLDEKPKPKGKSSLAEPEDDDEFPE